MALLKWIGCAILACLAVATILGILFVVRVLVLVFLVGGGSILTALLFHYYFTSNKHNKVP